MTAYSFTFFSIARDLSPNLAGGWATRNASPGSGPTRAYKFDDPPISPYNAHLAHGGTTGDSLLRMFVQFAGPLGVPPNSLQLSLHSGYEYNGFDGSITQEYVLVSAHHVTADLIAMAQLPEATVNADIDAAWLQLTSQPLEIASDDTLMPGAFRTPWRPTLNAAGLASARAASLAGLPLKFAVMVRQDIDGTGPSTPINVGEFLPGAEADVALGCGSRNGQLSLEYRLAIGASATHDSFDQTAILSLCYRDPGINPNLCGNLVMQTVHDFPDAKYAPRQGASTKTPLQLFRTGMGVRPAWDISLRVTTSRLGFLPANAPTKPEVNDGSLWHLVSLLGLSAEDLDFEPGMQHPPYLWLTVNYQSDREQWFPVEIDPDNSSFDPVTINPETKTAERILNIRFVARETYLRCLPAYFPSFTVRDIPGVYVTALPPHSPTGGGFFTVATFSAALPTHDAAGNELGLMDALLLNVGNGPYSWARYTILTLSADRTSGTLFAARDLSGSYLVPPSPQIAMRSVVQTLDYFETCYRIIGNVGQTVPTTGPQTHLSPQTYLLGAPDYA